jgi:hypothetical protein
MLTRYDDRDYACRGLYGEVYRGASADVTGTTVTAGTWMTGTSASGAGSRHRCHNLVAG